MITEKELTGVWLIIAKEHYDQEKEVWVDRPMYDCTPCWTEEYDPKIPLKIVTQEWNLSDEDLEFDVERQELIIFDGIEFDYIYKITQHPTAPKHYYFTVIGGVDTTDYVNMFRHICTPK